MLMLKDINESNGNNELFKVWIIKFKVENILEGCLDLIPPPTLFMKIQTMSTKIRQNSMRWSQCFSWHEETMQGTYSTPHFFLFVAAQIVESRCIICAHNLNFHGRWRWWDQTQEIFYFFSLLNLI